jgi:glycosyltransferase involved in cell wall biosynthesis
MVKVSVIIPCYNQGEFLKETVDSVLTQVFSALEIIIVNDGSTDEMTITTCERYAREGGRIRVLTTDNQGLASARNNGITIAQGEYILPLDADDIIESDYIAEAVAVLDTEPETGIVYCKARLFGTVDTDWGLPAYSIDEMLKNNVIFCSALYRKSDWELVGGYDPGMIYGWEDYDFWLSLIERGRGVRQLDKRYFNYRVSADSMVRSKDKWQKIEMFKRIYHRHTDLISQHIDVWIEQLLQYSDIYATSRLYVDCGNGVSDKDSVVRKVTPDTRVIEFEIDHMVDRQRIRFDPVDCPVCLKLFKVELLGAADSTSVSLETVSANSLYRSGNFFRFATQDPQMFIPVDQAALAEITGVRITLDFRALGDKALTDIIEYQKSVWEKQRRSSVLPRWWPLRKS